MLKKVTPDELREVAKDVGERVAADIAELQTIFGALPEDLRPRGLAVLDRVLASAGLLPIDRVRDHLVAAGRKGGLARKASITKRRARAIAKKAARASWVSRRAKAAEKDSGTRE